MRAAAANQAEIEGISRSIGELREFLGEAEAGGPCVPMRLYPAYRELARISGNESAGEKDLFVPAAPDAAHPPPAHAEPREITPGGFAGATERTALTLSTKPARLTQAKHPA